jgi:hypothetical protein
MTNAAPPILSPLQELQGIFNQGDYNAVFVPVSEESPFEQLLLGIAVPEGETEFPIQLFYLNDLSAVVEAQAGLDFEPDPAFILLFNLPLLTDVSAEDVPNLAQVANLFNQVTPIGAFGVSLKDGFFLKHSLIDIEARMSVQVLGSIVEYMTHISSKVLPLLERYMQEKPALPNFAQSVQQQFGAAA